MGSAKVYCGASTLRTVTPRQLTPAGADKGIKMRYGLLINLLLFCCASALAQQNLVRNGDFESYSNCPNEINQIKYADYWSSIDSNQSANADLAEYFNICAGSGPAITAGAPITYSFFKYPRSGKGMAGFYTYTNYGDKTYGSRNYVEGRFFKRLIAGKQYCVTFYVSLIDYGSRYAIKEIGAFLDNGDIDTTKTPNYTQTKYTPQIQNTAGVIKDTQNWIKIQGSFTANGTEQFITIGNFKDGAHTTLDSFPITGANWDGISGYSYYLLDDVSVVEIGTKADAGPDTHVGQGDSVFIGTHETALDCYWTKLGSSTVIGTTPGIRVKPTVGTSYVLTLNVCGAITKDTVKVEVWKLGVTGIIGQTPGYFLAPNPNNGNFQIGQTIVRDEVIEITAHNVLGQQVYSGRLTFKGGTADLALDNSIPAGIYYIYLRNAAGGVYALRFVKE